MVGSSKPNGSTAKLRTATRSSASTVPEVQTHEELTLLSDKEKQALYEQYQLSGASTLKEQTEQLMLHLGFKQPAPGGQGDNAPATKADIAHLTSVLLQSSTDADAKFENLKLQLGQKITDEVSGLSREVYKLKEDNRELRAQLRELQEVRDGLLATQMTVQQVQEELAGATRAAAKAAADVPELQQRASNLVLRHLPDCNSQEDAEQLVPELLATLAVGTEATTVTFRPPKTYAAAVSARPQGRPRTGIVVVGLASVQEKQNIY